ncbi:unnamed protein product [Rotaria socialis]|uniref:Tetraspanin n=1 Tax=Rotaria socialis TaxID=392032 RepID=A0A821R8T8_9BILA|nr:unnamed protein product [Rotaria socialis]CAF3547609.1 unnamed protein product [Rotaria socialis]CAF4475247.1 unnamed protein product [Rotaria socialis]CAF4839476.1 unnamed protein product [Rotaria socialis]
MATEIDGTSKGLLGTFAIFTLGSGLVSLIYGILLLSRNMSFNNNFGSINLFMTSIVLITAGGLLIIAVLLGVFGALKDVSPLRLVTLVLLLLLLVVLAVIGVWGMVSSKTGDLEKSIDTDIKLLKESTDATKSDIKKKAEFLNKYFNCCISCPSDANSEGEQQASSSSKPSGEGNTDNKPEMKDACATAYFQTKSKTIFCVAILALASAGAVFLALLIYALIFQRARAGYTAVSRG